MKNERSKQRGKNKESSKKDQSSSSTKIKKPKVKRTSSPEDTKKSKVKKSKSKDISVVLSDDKVKSKTKKRKSTSDISVDTKKKKPKKKKPNTHSEAILAEREGGTKKLPLFTTYDEIENSDLPAGTKRQLKRQQQRMNKLNSMFKIDSNSIQNLIGIGKSDTAISAFQKSMLRTIIDLIPLAESKYRENTSENAAYAMNSLISQARELISDIDAESDKSEWGGMIGAEIILPAFTKIVHNIVNTNFAMSKNLISLTSDSKTAAINRLINSASKELVAHIQGIHDQVNDQITDWIIS